MQGDARAVEGADGQELLKAIGKMNAKDLRQFAEQNNIIVDPHDAKYELWKKCHIFVKESSNVKK